MEGASTGTHFISCAKKFSSARLGSSVYCARLSGILPPDTRVLEMLCSPIDQEKYNREIGNTVNGTNDKGKTER